MNSHPLNGHSFKILVLLFFIYLRCDTNNVCRDRGDGEVRKSWEGSYSNYGQRWGLRGGAAFRWLRGQARRWSEPTLRRQKRHGRRNREDRWWVRRRLRHLHSVGVLQFLPVSVDRRQWSREILQGRRPKIWVVQDVQPPSAAWVGAGPF